MERSYTVSEIVRMRSSIMGWLVGLQHGPDDFRAATEETLKTYILGKCDPDEVVDYYHQCIKTRLASHA